MEIQVFEKSGFVSYGACGLPYFVRGSVHDISKLVAINTEPLRNKWDISAWMHREVIFIDLEKKEVSVKSLDTDGVSIHPYDRLVIATEATPIVSPVPGVHSNGVYYPRNMEDGIRPKATARENGGVCIIGGGATELETTEELSKAGLSVSLYEQFPRLLPSLDNAFSRTLEDTLMKCGIEVRVSTQISEILCENGKAKGIQTAYEEGEPSNIILVSTDVEPASALTEEAGLTLGLNGGIIVDDEMRTSYKDIWAYGDCVQVKNRITGKPAYVPLGTTTDKQGRIAGGNVAGGYDTSKGVLGSMVTRVFELFIATTGLLQGQTIREGFSVISVSITKADRASYYPGGRDSRIYLIVGKKTSFLLGARSIGSESIAGRINILATVITCGMTIGEMNELDLVYSPSAAPVYDPILVAASQAMKKITG